MSSVAFPFVSGHIVRSVDWDGPDEDSFDAVRNDQALADFDADFYNHCASCGLQSSGTNLSGAHVQLCDSCLMRSVIERVGLGKATSALMEATKGHKTVAMIDVACDRGASTCRLTFPTGDFVSINNIDLPTGIREIAEGQSVVPMNRDLIYLAFLNCGFRRIWENPVYQRVTIELAA